MRSSTGLELVITNGGEEKWKVHSRDPTHENSRIKEVLSKEVTNDIIQENSPEVIN